MALTQGVHDPVSTMHQSINRTIHLHSKAFKTLPIDAPSVGGPPVHIVLLGNQ